jgi:hypothetical protein
MPPLLSAVYYCENIGVKAKLYTLHGTTYYLFQPIDIDLRFAQS